jgi:protein-lysine N-methyltransferase EEF2KMT
MAEPATEPPTAARQKHYVTYVLPSTPLGAGEQGLAPDSVVSAAPVATAPPSITLFESHDVLASAGTTGRRTWETALHLGSVLLGSPWRERVAGATVLELGAGTGFLAILCARHLQAQFVLATDGNSQVVDDLQRNLDLNELQGKGLVQTAVLKWGQHGQMGELLDANMAGDGSRRDYDLILGSDLVRLSFLAWLALPGLPGHSFPTISRPTNNRSTTEMPQSP